MMPARIAGFTLVEIAIVLVIVGLLLGGALKGQDLIDSARAKSIAGEFRNALTMVNAYQDRFRALPGDDRSAGTRFGTNATLSGNGNGMIDGSWNDTGADKEPALAWQHLRLANLASGSTEAPAAGDWEPRNAEGGRIGLQSQVPFAGMRGRLFVCQGNVSGRVALQIDTSLDDGQPGEGWVRFGSELGKTADAVDESLPYLICASA